MVEETKIINSMNGQIDTIQFYVKSPTGKCSYLIYFNRVGSGKLTLFQEDGLGSDTSTDFVVKDKKDIEDLEALFILLDTSVTLTGSLWKGGWKYLIHYQGDKKIEVYKKQESLVVMKLLDLIEKYSEMKIDYSCF